MSNFYNRGRMDCLQKLPANPNGSGAFNPQAHNEYMNGYNSVQSKTYVQTFQNIRDIIEASHASQSKEGLAYLLSKLLITSLNEPADRETETDQIFHKYLDLLETHNALDLKAGFVELYNAIQKSKRFELRAGEVTKHLRSVSPDENQKKNPKK